MNANILVKQNARSLYACASPKTRVIKPGRVSSTRFVPESIPKPDYVRTGYPKDTSVLMPWDIATLNDSGMHQLYESDLSYSLIFGNLV